MTEGIYIVFTLLKNNPSTYHLIDLTYLHG